MRSSRPAITDPAIKGDAAMTERDELFIGFMGGVVFMGVVTIIFLIFTGNCHIALGDLCAVGAP